MVTYIDPDGLSSSKLLVSRLVFQLSSSEAKHVLSTTQKTLAGRIVYASLFSQSTSLYKQHLDQSVPESCRSFPMHPVGFPHPCHVV